jgi:hypothetical protein
VTLRVAPSRSLKVWIPPTSVSQGGVRSVRFKEVGRTQQMIEKGAKQSIQPSRSIWLLRSQNRTLVGPT